jgi:hypothetical protein
VSADNGVHRAPAGNPTVTSPLLAVPPARSAGTAGGQSATMPLPTSGVAEVPGATADAGEAEARRAIPAKSTAAEAAIRPLNDRPTPTSC